MKIKYLIIILIVLIGFTSCSVLLSSDYTVDQKVMNMANAEIAGLRTRSGTIDAWDPRVARVSQIGQKIFMTLQIYLQEKKKENLMYNMGFEIVVVNEPKVDCYSLGAGKIVMFGGLLDQLSSDDEIAYIIAHELAHDIDKHSYKKLKSSFVSEIGSSVINNVVSYENKSKELYLSAFGVTSSAFGAIKFSDKDEFDADELALLLMSKARYNPKAAPVLINKLEAFAKSGFKVTFIEIHPTSDRLHQQIVKLSEKYFNEYFLQSVR